MGGSLKKLIRLMVALLAMVALIPTVSIAQSNAWRIQQQQQMRQQQMQQQQAQRAAENARRAQQAAETARRAQQAQQAAATARRAQQAADGQRRMQTQQQQAQRQQSQQQAGLQRRAANQNTAPAARRDEMVQRMGTIPRTAPTGEVRGAANRNVGVVEQRGFVSSGGVATLTRPLTAAEIKRGFTNRVLGDGRGLVRFQGRVIAVPARAISGLVRAPANQNTPTPANQNVAPSRTTAQASGLNARVANLASRQATRQQRPANQNDAGRSAAASASRNGMASVASAGSGGEMPPCETLTCRFNRAANPDNLSGHPTFARGSVQQRQLSALVETLRPVGVRSVSSQQANLASADRVTRSNGVRGSFQLAAGAYQPAYADGRTAYQMRASLPEGRFVRLIPASPSGPPNPVGSWFVERDAIRGLSAEDIKDKLALPAPPAFFAPVSGQNILLQVGEAGGNEFGSGGFVQFESMEGGTVLQYGDVRPLNEL